MLHILNNQLRESRSGFSLFELLISLALMTFIAVGLSGAFGLGISVWDRSEAVSNFKLELSARRKLRGLVMQALPLSRSKLGFGGLEGKSTGFEFATLAETPFETEAALSRVQISIDSDAIHMSIVLINDDGDEISSERYVMLQSASEIEFEYLKQIGETHEWVSDWSSIDSLPKLVRISASVDAKPNWPDFIVRPRLQ